jgi:hypothetical protein
VGVLTFNFAWEKPVIAYTLINHTGCFTLPIALINFQS